MVAGYRGTISAGFCGSFEDFAEPIFHEVILVVQHQLLTLNGKFAQVIYQLADVGFADKDIVF